jgi:hypothetical protein
MTSAADVELNAVRKFVTGTIATEPAAASGGASDGVGDGNGVGSELGGASEASVAVGLGLASADARTSAEGGSPLPGAPPQPATRLTATASARSVRDRCTTRIVSPRGQKNAPFGRANGA